jgi:colanic acid/amylovoran biosynthesis glycosyltransferase
MVSPHDTTIAVYSQNYLSQTMTFVYRQLQGVVGHYRPLVLSTNLENVERFPFANIYAANRNPIQGIFNRVYNRLGYYHLGGQQLHYFRRVLVHNRVRLVHAHFGPSGIEILPLLKKLGIPLLVTFHGYDVSRLLSRRCYSRGLIPLFEYAHIIGVSDQITGRLLSLGAEGRRTWTHRIGIPPEYISYKHRRPLREIVERNDQVVISQVSSFVEKKGHEYTITAFANFTKEYPNSRLILAGDGPLRGRMEEMCRTLGVYDRVSFVGWIDDQDVQKVLRGSDIFVHHSITAQNGDMEGIPTSIMEAMATGLPVVSTYHSGIPELIDDGVNGFLIGEKDTRAYTERLISMLDIADNEIGKNAVERILRDFNMARQNRELTDIYDSIISGRPSGTTIHS